jgi:hypothetical protein
MKTITLKIGASILARISNEVITGKIIRFGTYNGKEVADLDNNRFVYISQIIHGFNN